MKLKLLLKFRAGGKMLNSSVPLIDLLTGFTERLYVAPIAYQDIEDVRLMHNQASILEQLSDSKIVTVQQQVIWFNRLKTSTDSGRIVLKRREDFKLVGVFSLDRIDQENLSVLVGLDIDEAFRRRGFAREAYFYMFNRIFTDWNFNRAYLETLRSNDAANSLYRSIGMVYEGCARNALLKGQEFVDINYYSILRDEWLRQVA